MTRCTATAEMTRCWAEVVTTTSQATPERMSSVVGFGNDTLEGGAHDDTLYGNSGR